MNMESGMWSAAALMIVVTSWVLYRYVAPEGWKEWRNAGLVQAFIIALYAEMYGFPLTLYALTGFFGVDISVEPGHLWATLLGYGYVGGVIEMLIGYAYVFFGLGLLVEGWREVYKARQEGRLVTGGLYDLVRHPQYTGIFIALFGQLIHWPTIPTLVLFPVITWVYVRLARREEEQMIQQFGERYLAYQQRVPAFFPKWGRWRDLLDEARLFSSGKISSGTKPQEPGSHDQHKPKHAAEHTGGPKSGPGRKTGNRALAHQKENGTVDDANPEKTRPFGGIHER